MPFTDPFTDNEDKKGLSLPGIIDIIFLLLVFSLVRLSISSSTDGEENHTRDTFFPIVENVMDEIGPYVSTLTFEIDRLNPGDPSSEKVIYALLPSHDLNQPITWEEGKKRAIQESRYAVFPMDFVVMPEDLFRQSRPCRLIREEIARYKAGHFRRPHPSNTINVLALKGTEFRVIRYILDQCTQYGDTIPVVSFHVATP